MYKMVTEHFVSCVVSDQISNPSCSHPAPALRRQVFTRNPRFKPKIEYSSMIISYKRRQVWRQCAMCLIVLRGGKYMWSCHLKFVKKPTQRFYWWWLKEILIRQHLFTNMAFSLHASLSLMNSKYGATLNCQAVRVFNQNLVINETLNLVKLSFCTAAQT